MSPAHKNGKKGNNGDKKKPVLKVIKGGLGNVKKKEPLVEDIKAAKNRKPTVWGLDRKLLEAVQEENVFKVKDAIEKGASLTVTDEEGRNIWQIAALGGCEELIQYLNKVLKDQYEMMHARYGRHLDKAGQRPLLDKGKAKVIKLADEAPTPEEILNEVSTKYQVYYDAQKAGERGVFITLGHIGNSFTSELEDMKKVFRSGMAVTPDGLTKDAKYMRRSGRYAAAVIALIAANYEEVQDVSQEILSMLENKSKTTRRSGILALEIFSKRGIYLPDSKERLKELAENDTEPKVRREAEKVLKLYP